MGNSSYNTEEQKSEKMTFGEAIEALKQGKMLARNSWGYGDFIFMQVPAKIALALVPKMQSLPEAVKEKFLSRSDFDTIKYSNQIAFVTVKNEISGYAPTPADVLANDWIVFQ